jgi:hypothetical protein
MKTIGLKERDTLEKNCKRKRSKMVDLYGGTRMSGLK